jgi:hypothetical protein
MGDGGGICGGSSGSGGYCFIQNCYSTGQIVQDGYFGSSGGICGYAVGFNNGYCLVQNCYSNGTPSIMSGQNYQTYSFGFNLNPANGNYDLSSLNINNINNASTFTKGTLNNPTTILDNQWGTIKINNLNNFQILIKANANAFISTSGSYPRLSPFKQMPWNNAKYNIYNPDNVTNPNERPTFATISTTKDTITLGYDAENIFTATGVPNNVDSALLSDSNWTDSVTFNLLKNISLNSTYATKFSKLSAKSIFNGQNYTIDFGDTEDIIGLFSTIDTNFNDAITIKNLGILNGTTAIRGGFIINESQIYFKIQNCYSTGKISDYGGGICGYGVIGQAFLENCYSIGNQIGKGAGGICGAQAGSYNGICNIINCYSTGSIGQDGGGICGQLAGIEGNCTIQNCYSTGSINQAAGGICGGQAGSYNGICDIRNCYSTGSIGLQD